MRGPKNQSLLHRFLTETASCFGQSIAVQDGDRSLSFEELLGQSRTLAAFLRKRGLRKGDRVLFVMPKSMEAIIGIFAALLDGGIYVPLDPHWPVERLWTVLQDCAPRFVILCGSRPLASRLGIGEIALRDVESTPLIVGAEGTVAKWSEAMVEEGEGEYWEADVTATDPALILFTSGSTGPPKGVAISHKAVAAFVCWAADEFGITGEDRLACPSPLSFDLSTLDIFGMAVCGATCMVVSERISWMPKFLTQFIAEQKITLLYAVPSLLSGMLFDGGLRAGQLSMLRICAFAGEVFPSPILEKWRALVPQAFFYNLYGPTETNVVTWYRVPEIFDSSAPIPIGRACPYAELTLDPGVEDKGKAGELLVSGESVMLGYWNRPEETQKVMRFIMDDAGQTKRFYRTGDRVGYDAVSGNYIFMGRMDRQVKRRGYRIELDEIERVLLLQDHILEAAVTACEDLNRQAVILAGVRVVDGIPVTQVDIRVRCAQHLPSYMIPDRIVTVRVIPKGDRGKTDYAALAEVLRGI